MTALADALAAFHADAGAHGELCEVVDAVLAPAPTDTLLDVTLEDALQRFALDEQAYKRLLADPGWTGDLVVFLAAVFRRVDPAIRSAFPAINAFAEGAAAALPGGSLVAHLLLVLAEGPLLSLVEGWLQTRASGILAAERDAGLIA